MFYCINASLGDTYCLFLYKYVFYSGTVNKKDNGVVINCIVLVLGVCVRVFSPCRRLCRNLYHTQSFSFE